MKFPTLLTHDSGQTIWRLLLNGEDTLLIEERDLANKTASFSCYNLATGTSVLDSLTFDEPFWVGIEDFRDDIIYFHHYRKPDMPHHQGILAYSVEKKKTVWQNVELTFGFLDGGTLYALRQEFESAYYYALDAATGEVLSEPGNDTAKVAERRLAARESADYSEYVFPEQYSQGTNPAYDAIIGKYSQGALQEIETLEFEGMLFFTLHHPNAVGTHDQELYCVSLNTKKTLFTETINKNQRALLFDSYFIYKRNCILLFDKQKVVVYSLY